RQIWLVVSQPVVAQAFARKLRHLGAEVEIFNKASKVHERLASSRRVGELPAALVVDYAFDEGSALELCLALRQQVGGEHLPILLLAGLAVPATREAMAQAGIRGQISRTATLQAIAHALAGSALAPLTALHDTSTPRTEVKPSRSARFHGSGARVLVVDDVPSNLEVLRLMLQRYGIYAQTAQDGAQALFLAENSTYDLIFLDCKMPTMDGYETARRLRALERAEGRPHAVVIAYTANALVEDRLRCEQAGMDHLMTKPFRREELEEVLTRWLPAESDQRVSE
ncbi:MAG: response regulator, partial [Opitutales bacterium]